jgi:hypothetical protein
VCEPYLLHLRELQLKRKQIPWLVLGVDSEQNALESLETAQPPGKQAFVSVGGDGIRAASVFSVLR